MTITPANVDQIPGVIARCRTMGFNLFSFQPAAYVGDERRWKEDYRTLDPDEVWRRIEEGAGAAPALSDLPGRRRALQPDRLGLLPRRPLAQRARRRRPRGHGGARRVPGPLRRRAFQRADCASCCPASAGSSSPTPISSLSRPGGSGARCAASAACRQLLRHRIVPMTFVMHRFMHADDVDPRLGTARTGRDERRPSDPRDPGAPPGLLVRHGAPRDRPPGPGLRAALGAGPRREPSTRAEAADHAAHTSRASRPQSSPRP